MAKKSPEPAPPLVLEMTPQFQRDLRRLAKLKGATATLTVTWTAATKGAKPLIVVSGKLTFAR